MEFVQISRLCHTLFPSLRAQAWNSYTHAAVYAYSTVLVLKRMLLLCRKMDIKYIITSTNIYSAYYTPSRNHDG